MEPLSAAGVVNLIGLTANGAGVVLLGYEVAKAHGTEVSLMHISRALRTAEELKQDPVEKARRDVAEVEGKFDKMSPYERFVWGMQAAIVKNEVPEWLRKAMSEHAEKVLKVAQTHYQVILEQVTPKRLALRRNLLRLGVILVIVGIFVQGVATVVSSQQQPAGVDSQSATGTFD